MRRPTWLRIGLAAALLPPLAVVAAATPGAAQPVQGFTAKKISPTARVTSLKSPTSKLAQTDPALLGRTDPARIPVIVKLDYDSVATYSGGLPGYDPTSPTVTGRRLSGSVAERRYGDYVAAREDTFVKELTRAVPGAAVRQRLRTVYGGVAATVPANKISDLLKLPGVAAVQQDRLHKPLTDASGEFIGATALYPRLGGNRDAGKGVIVGVIDTGAWPEHPSFADQGRLGTPPAKPDGTARTCDFGDNPQTPATDVFACGNKLIGGAKFLDTYDLFIGDDIYPSARDSGGHGTHTASTAAGNVISSARVFDVERGPLAGVAPGAWVSVYKGLGPQGGFSSDLAAAAQQAVRDGVHVINYSIGGDPDRLTNPVMLAFLDAYAAGVFVSASAGNSGPGAGTADNVPPWVTTVAASTQTREFTSTLTLKGGADTLTLTGASITGGVTDPAPVVLAESVAGYTGGALCAAAANPGTFAGRIVACQRGVIGRAEKGNNVVQGGALGMILYNPTLADVETDNHWLPAVHLADGTRFKAFMAGHPEVTATFTAGTRANGQADVMAAFSSRGPSGPVLKPDIAAPGVQILAGNTPTPDNVAGGPPGQLFQAIAGTSMSAPHIAGSAALLKALHPDWTPGQIKSALMTTAKTDLVKEDTTTPADPFDYGAGREDLTKAGNPGLTFDDTAERMAALGIDPVLAVHLNLPSVNAPQVPGEFTTVRTAKNVTDRRQTYRVRTSAPAGSRITVSPGRFTLAPGQEADLAITIASTAPTAQYFGQVTLDPDGRGLPTLHLPVAFVPRQGDVALSSSCAPDTVSWLGTSTCTVTTTNNSFAATTASMKTRLDPGLLVSQASGATVTSPMTVEKPLVSLVGRRPGTPSLAPGTVIGQWLSLPDSGITPEPIGDEDILNFTVPEFVFNGEKFTTIGIDSNGYAIAGGGEAEDNNCCNLPAVLPDRARPNNVLAPFWTDLDGRGAPGIFAALVSGDAGEEWLVFEWQVNVFATTSHRHFQLWIGLGDTQDIVFAYDPAALPADPNIDFLVGAENSNASGGQSLPRGTLPTEDLRVTSTGAVLGTASYTVTVRGLAPGVRKVTSSMTTPAVQGTTVVVAPVTVNSPSGRR